MSVLILLTAYLVYAANAAPQFVTFKDGKIGVNFGGFHADAGLGGFLTGDAAHGGLSASAGTPWGQNAAAGLGGSTDGRSSGFGYAGAQAIPSVGASAAFGGTAGQDGFIGSEAHANGKIHSNTINSAAQPINQHNYEPHSPLVPVTSGPIAPSLETRSDFIQKIKPPKKYSLIKSENVSSKCKRTTQKQESHSTPNAPVENVDHTLIANGSSDPAGIHIPTASNSNPATMIHIHRQRMRERRRLQQQQQETQNELQHKRTNEHRIRARQRLHQIQRDVVVHNKDIDVYRTSTDITTQQPVKTDVNVVHSKHLSKSFHKSVNTEPDSPVSPRNEVHVHYNANPGAVGNILNIPIGILRTIQESLTGLQVEKNLSIAG